MIDLRRTGDISRACVRRLRNPAPCGGPSPRSTTRGAWPASRRTGTTHPRGLRRYIYIASSRWRRLARGVAGGALRGYRPPAPFCCAARRAGISPTARRAFPSGAAAAPALPLASSTICMRPQRLKLAQFYRKQVTCTHTAYHADAGY